MPPSTACMEAVNPCSPSTALELLALVPQFLHLCSTSCFRLELCDSATRMAYFMSCPPPRPCFAAPLSAMWPRLTFPALSSPSSLPVWQVPAQTQLGRQTHGLPGRGLMCPFSGHYSVVFLSHFTALICSCPLLLTNSFSKVRNYALFLCAFLLFTP